MGRPNLPFKGLGCCICHVIHNQLKSVRVRTGVADSSYTELLSGDLPEGTELVTGIVLEQARATTGGPSVGGNPFMGGPGPGGFRPGGPR